MPTGQNRRVRFRTTVVLGGKTATGMPVPADVVAQLGSKRAPVVVTLAGYTYRTTVAPMGGEFFVPLSAEHRTKAGVAAGDAVDVDIERDDAPREVAVPDDLAAAIGRVKVAATTFDKLAYSHRKEYVRWIEEAKRPATRAARVAKAVEMLREGKTR
jgi:hypothetical protein